MKNPDITKASANEAEALQVIARQTFQEAFSNLNSGSDMEKYLESSFSLEKLTAELNNQESHFYFASLEQKIIGYLKLNFASAQTDINDANALEIERIYVLQEFHGKKVAQTLLYHAIMLASQANLEYIWLGVWEENPRAIRFYKKNGFFSFGKHNFRLGDEEQTDLLMKLLLKTNSQS